MVKRGQLLAALAALHPRQRLAGAPAAEKNKSLLATWHGDGDAHGHGITLDVTGGGGTIDISQTGVKDNIVDLTIDGDDFDVDITQSD